MLDTSTSPSVGFQSVNEGTIGVNGGTLEFIGRADATTLINNPGETSVGDSGSGLVKLDGSNAVFDLFPNGATGTLTLSDNPGNVIEGVTGTETLINGSGETVSGAGTIKNLALTNNGTIIASGTNALNIIHNAAGFTNNGTLQVNSGSALNLSGTTMSTNSATLTVDGTLNLTSGSTLGFSIAGSNGAVTNNGAMNLNSATLAINDGGNGHMLTLAGDGALTLSDNPANMISGSRSDETLVIGSGQTLRGSGTFSNLAVVLDGQVEATAVNALNFKPNAGGVTNNGIFNIFSGARVNVTGTLMNTNFIELVGGGPRTNTLNVTGRFTNAGAIQIQDANTAKFWMARIQR